MTECSISAPELARDESLVTVSHVPDARMYLTLVGRLIYLALTLANLAVVSAALSRSEWLGAGVGLLLVALFGIPAATGRDRLAAAAPYPRWLGSSERPRDRVSHEDG